MMDESAGFSLSVILSHSLTLYLIALINVLNEMQNEQQQIKFTHQQQQQKKWYNFCISLELNNNKILIGAQSV